MSKKPIKIVHVRVGQAPEVKEVPDSLESLQSLVGGYIEPVRIANGVEFVVNEMGRMNDLPVNGHFPIVNGDSIRGDFFICGPNLRSLSDADCEKYSKLYAGDR